MLENLKQNLVNAPVVKFQDYNYFIFSIADGIPTIEPELFKEVIVDRFSCFFINI